ncbi:uncharacterized protein LOC142238449 [Haematobia irritans]|uniref:uncharacterized protein LOC142238449 n=1 Tax=Haematobia irritans TaxID=7368 RepID=UPI003F4F9DD7
MSSESARVANVAIWLNVSFVMAIFSIMMYTYLSAYNIAGLLLYYEVIAIPATNEHSNYGHQILSWWLSNIRVTYLYGFMAELFLRFTMFILSVLLIVGLKLKRHYLISPWLIMGFIMVGIGFCISLFSIEGAILIGLQTFIWFPVYTFYKKMRKTRYWQQTGFINTYTVWDNHKKYREWRSQFPSLKQPGDSDN